MFDPIFILRRKVVVPNFTNHLLRHLVSGTLDYIGLHIKLQNLLVPICDNIGVQWLYHFLDRVLSVFDDSVMTIFSHVVLFALESV
jgi:hypothetical protein